MKRSIGRLVALGLAVGVLCTSALAQGAPVELEEGHVAVLAPGDGEVQPQGVKEAVELYDAAADRWIVDLRQDGGGDLSAAAEAAAVFAGGGELAFLRSDTGAISVKRVEGSAVTADPVIVLVGKDTGPAGELFAADIRDAGAGLVIGSRTGGAGRVETGEGEMQVFSAGMSSYDVMGVIPHLCVEEELALRVARLLCGSFPTGGKDGLLCVHLGGWRWYVDTASALADPEAFQALLEALPPRGEVYVGAGSGWVGQEAATVASWYCPGYSPRVFADVEATSPYADAINTLKSCGVLKGDQAGNFLPKVALDRATLCALLAQAMNYPKSDDPPAFSDTPAEAWYTPYVTTLSAMGIVNGVGGGLFDPSSPISHEQFMTILARIAANTDLTCRGAMEVGPGEEELASGDLDGYADWAKTGVWLLEGKWHAAARDIDPKGATLREEAAYDLWSMLTTLGLM